jgi:hypothetical protein
MNYALICSTKQHANESINQSIDFIAIKNEEKIYHINIQSNSLRAMRDQQKQAYTRLVPQMNNTVVVMIASGHLTV